MTIVKEILMEKCALLVEDYFLQSSNGMINQREMTYIPSPVILDSYTEIWYILHSNINKHMLI